MPITLAAPAAAFALVLFSSCTEAPPLALDFKYNVQPPAFSTALTAAALQQMQGGADVKNGVIGGRYRHHVMSDTALDYAEVPQILGDSYCLEARLLKVKIDLVQNAWVASEYVPGSCRYNIVYGHEMTHAKIAQDTLAEFMPGIEAMVRAKVATMKFEEPLPQEKMQAARDAALADIQTALADAINRVEMVMDLRQAVIDTPEAYAQSSKVCGNEPQWGRR